MQEQIAGLQIKQTMFVWFIVLMTVSAFIWGQVQGYYTLDHWFMPKSLALLWEAVTIWTLWTPVFIHYTWVHLLVNLYLWWDFARVIELVSRPLLIFLFLSSGLISNFCEYLAFGPDFGGMSGVVYALLGFLWVYSSCHPAGVFKINKLYVVVLLVNLLLCMTGLIGDFSNVAHISGLVYGMLAGYCYGRIERRTKNHQCG